MRTGLLITFLLAAALGFAVAGVAGAQDQVIWASRAGGTDFDTGTAIASYADGSTVVTGGFLGTATFGSGDSMVSLTAAGNVDLFVARYNADGSLAWAKKAGGGGQDRGEGAAAYSDGSAVVTGWFAGTATFGQGEQQVSLTSAGDYDLFVAKYDSDGVLLWAKGAGGASTDQAYAVAALSDGGAVVTGTFLGSSTFGEGPSQVTLVSAGFWDIFVAKYGADGSLAWAKRAGAASSSTEAGYGVASYSDGSAVVAGWFAGTTTFGEGLQQVSLTSAGSYDVFLAKYDTNGALVWAKQAGGANSDQALAVARLADGGAVVTGAFQGSCTFGEGPSQVTLISEGFWDLFVAKYGSDGSFLWAKSAGGVEDDVGLAVAALPDGSAAVTGYFNESATFGEGEQQVTLVSEGGWDAFVAEYDTNGALSAAWRLGGEGSDAGRGVAWPSPTALILTGDFDVAMKVGLPSGQVALTSAGGTDLFVAKYGKLPLHALTVQSNPVGDVPIGGAPDAVLDSTSYTAQIDEGARVTLNAPKVAGVPTDWTCLNWMVGGTVIANPATFTMTEDRTATAYYSQNSLKVLYPDAEGITLMTGQSCSVAWSSVNLPPKSKVMIELVKGGTQAWTLSASATKSPFKWSVGKAIKGVAPYPEGTDYTIRVSTAEGLIADVSDNAFAIGHLTLLTVTGSATVSAGVPQQYSCTGHFSTGADQDVTALVAWSCSGTKSAKMGKGGLLTAKPVTDPGPCTVTASYGKKTGAIIGTLDVTITP